MNMLLIPMALVLAVAMIGSAALALFTSTRITAVLASGLVSLFASVLFLLLAAPDVAMTEAAIGSGLTTFLFVFVLSRIRRESDQ
ncbi:MAG: DUF4040 domain-containing protein [Alphaproteobacteria bacterium]|nr:DUF4040 domain-containing protein [Alphaproteobacteria bacterium]